MTDFPLSRRVQCDLISDLEMMTLAVALPEGQDSGCGDRSLRFDRMYDIIIAIADLKQDLWDIDPSLVDEQYISFDPDLAGLFRVLDHELSQDEHVWRDVVNQILAYAPESIVEVVRAFTSRARCVDYLHAWWSAQDASLLPFNKIDRELNAERRWRRVGAARHLRDLGGPDLLNPTIDDVDPHALSQWRELRRLREID